MDNNKVPTKPSDLNLEFFQRYVNNNISDVKVEPIVALLDSGVELENGGGFTGGNVVRVRLKYNTDNRKNNNENNNNNNKHVKPESVVCKLVQANPSYYSLQVLFGVFQWQIIFRHREFKFYESLRPIVTKAGVNCPHSFLTLKGYPDDFETSLLPSRLKLLYQKPRFENIVVMEDPPGYKTIPSFTHVPLVYSKMALTNIARLHGHYWNALPKDETTGKDLLSRIDDGKPNDGLTSANDGAILERLNNWVTVNQNINTWATDDGDKVLNKLLNVISEDDENPFRLATFKSRFINWMKDGRLCSHLLHFHNETLPDTFCHGDVHGGNHLYPEDVDNDDIILIDWQMFGIGKAVEDVVYYMMLSIESDNFEEDHVLYETYYNSLCASAKKANNKKFDPKIFTYERFLDDIYKTICKYTIRMMSTRLRPNGMKFLMAVVPGFKMATKESTFAFLVSYCV